MRRADHRLEQQSLQADRQAQAPSPTPASTAPFTPGPRCTAPASARKQQTHLHVVMIHPAWMKLDIEDEVGEQEKSADQRRGRRRLTPVIMLAQTLRHSQYAATAPGKIHSSGQTSRVSHSAFAPTHEKGEKPLQVMAAMPPSSKRDQCI